MSTANQPATPPDDDPGMIENSPELRQFIAQCVSNVNALDVEGSGVNESKASIYATLKERGIPKKAFNLAREVAGMSTKNQEAFDIAYAICRQASNRPMQAELFESAIEARQGEALPSEAPTLRPVENATSYRDPAGID